MAAERDSEGRLIIRLDGTFGTGFPARLTIITLDKVNGTKETTYEFPYMLIKFDVLQQLTDASQNLGFRIEKILPAEVSEGV
jgi:hypothetical protein